MSTLRCVWMMVVISFQMVSSILIPRTLPGLFLGISTSILQCSRVGSSPLLKASVIMLVSVIQGSGSSSRCKYQVRRSSVHMPLGPGDLPVRMQRRAKAISSLEGALSGMSVGKCCQHPKKLW